MGKEPASEHVAKRNVCREVVEPIPRSLLTTEFTDFEEDFKGWDQTKWEKLEYDSRLAHNLAISRPPGLAGLDSSSSNEVGATLATTFPQFSQFQV